MKLNRDVVNKVWQGLGTIKLKIKNFDLKPAKPMLAEKLAAVDAMLDQEYYQTAVRMLRKLMVGHPNNITVVEKLVELYSFLDDKRALQSLLEYAINRFPQNLNFYDSLAVIYQKDKKYRRLARLYAKGLKEYPDLSYMQHFHQVACRRTTKKAPKLYIENLFNGYAETYEDSMHTLQYQAPQYLIKEIVSKFDGQIEKAVDLGCGTGLAGQHLMQRIQIKHLIGVDIAEEMIKKCSAKSTYHELQQLDFEDFLQAAEPGYDLILSSDALIYHGDFNVVFANAARILKPGGYLAFTVEKLLLGNYKLSISGRYQHSLRYLKSLYKKYQFSKMYSQTIDLRKEYGNMVAGYLVLIQK